MNAIIGLLAGYFICKLFAGGTGGILDLFTHVSSKPDSDKVKKLPADNGVTTVKFDEKQPEGLPPWPSGWKVAPKATPAMVDRAWKLLPMLKNGERKVEQGPDGAWLSYFRSKNPATGKVGVTVFVPKTGAGAPTGPVTV